MIISEAKWDEIKDFSGGIAVAKSNSGYFLLDKSGQTLNQEGFSQVCRLKDGYFLVEKEGKKRAFGQIGK